MRVDDDLFKLPMLDNDLVEPLISSSGVEPLRIIFKLVMLTNHKKYYS